MREEKGILVIAIQGCDLNARLHVLEDSPSLSMHTMKRSSCSYSFHNSGFCGAMIVALGAQLQWQNGVSSLKDNNSNEDPHESSGFVHWIAMLTK
jgi:hypothetical protein